MDLAADVLSTLSIILIGLIAGAESATLVIHATIDRLPFAAGREPAQAINRRLGSLMPMVMPPAVILSLITALVRIPSVGAVAWFGVTGLLVIMLLITFLGLAPLNKLEEGATPETPPTDWQSWRARWQHLHTGRVACDLLALIVAAIAIVWT